MNWGEILITMLGSSVVASVITAWLGRRKANAEIATLDSAKTKNEADATQIISDTAVSLIEPLRLRVEELEIEVKNNDQQLKKLTRQLGRYARRLEHLMTGITILLKQLADMDAAPCWKPDEWNPDDDREE